LLITQAVTSHARRIRVRTALAAAALGDDYWEFHWPGHALDTAKVLGSRGRITVPYRTFSDTLLTQEQSPLEPGIKDQKWSVRGIGYVQESAASGSREQIKLVSVTHH
jgi:hypothetical protein